MPHVPGVTHRQVDVGRPVRPRRRGGLGEPLVLLHGWPQHWYCWRSVVPLLADRYRLVMPDLRGHGWTSAPGHGYDKEQLATDLLGLLDELSCRGSGWSGTTGAAGPASWPACGRPSGSAASWRSGIVHPFQQPRSARRCRAGASATRSRSARRCSAELGMQLARS
jgi:hypothetical protein